jgi:uncharacterized protein YkwD
VQLKRIAVYAFLFFILASPGAKGILCFEQEQQPPFQKKDAPTIERDLYNLVNMEREKLGLAPVILYPSLSFLARKHSQDMALRGDISHFSTSGEPYSERLVDGEFYFIKNGENVAFSQTFVPELIHQGFIDSPGHRANILDPDFDQVGIGVVFKEENGYYVTQDFIKSLKPKGKEEARAEVEEHINSMRRKSSLPPLIFSKEANAYAQQYSLDKIKDRPLPPLPTQFGETHLFYIKSPIFEYLYSKHEDILLDKNCQTAGLGIDFSRCKENPGGTYFITFLLFPENKYKSKSNNELKEIVLHTINNTRENKGVASMTEDKMLAASAKKALRLIYAQKNTSSMSIPRSGRTTVISYVTEDPTLLPLGLKIKIENDFIFYKRIGIGILFGKDVKYPRGAFWVVILLEE